jgi:hypothetical protein
MKTLRGRHIINLQRRRRENQNSSHKKTHWLDMWLPRVSHFAQFGLFAITIWSLYFTVLPLYQKAVLEEAIARKGIELAASEKSLEQSYSRVRAFAVREFVFSTGAYCSGLMLPPPVLVAPDEKTSPGPSAAEKILKTDAGACIIEEFQKAQSLKELRPADIQTLSSHVERIAIDLKVKQEMAWKDFESIPQKAKANPSILKPVGPFSERMITYMSKSQPRSFTDAWRFSQAVKETQSAAAYEYVTYVRNQISTLRFIEWSTSK